MGSGSEVLRWKNGFRAFHRAKMSSQDTQDKTLYLRRVARTCIVAVQVGTARFVLIGSLRPKAHVIATSYLFQVLQNCVDLLIKHNIYRYCKY